MEKFDKEFLNAEKCMADMKYWLKGEAISYLVDIAVFASLAGIPTLFAGIPNLSRVQPSLAVSCIIACLWLPSLAYLIGGACFLIPHAIRIRGRKYLLVEDTLSGINVVEKNTRGNWHIEWRFVMFRSSWVAWFTRNRYRRHLFYFEGNGVFTAKYVSTQRTSMGDNFVWSHSYRMGDAALASASHTGDKFYLLTYETGRKEKKTKIAFIYPQKFFEWKDL